MRNTNKSRLEVKKWAICLVPYFMPVLHVLYRTRVKWVVLTIKLP